MKDRKRWECHSIRKGAGYSQLCIFLALLFSSLKNNDVNRLESSESNDSCSVFFSFRKDDIFFFLPLLHEKDVELKFFPLFFIFFLFLLIRDKKKMAPNFLWHSLVADGASMTPLFALKFRIIFFRNAPHSRSRVPIVYVLLGTDSMRMKY